MALEDADTMPVELQRKSSRLARVVSRLTRSAPQAGGPAPSGPSIAPIAMDADLPSGSFTPTPVTIERMRAMGLLEAGRRTRAGEEFRLVASHLRRRGRGDLRDGRRLGGAIMVCSSQAGEGKSFTSLNLAATLARNGPHGTILVDLDSKRDAVSSLLGLREAPGLNALELDPSLEPGSLLHPTPLPRLAIMPLGRFGTEGLEDETVAALERLARAFPDHTLVLDMPPCLSTSDASTLAIHVGQILLVVEAERTQRREVETSLALLEACPTISLVLNKTRRETRGQFGGSYYGDYFGRQ